MTPRAIARPGLSTATPTEDPIGFEGRDANLYAYVGNRPVNVVDPSGLQYGFAYPPRDDRGTIAALLARTPSDDTYSIHYKAIPYHVRFDIATYWWGNVKGISPMNNQNWFSQWANNIRGKAGNSYGKVIFDHAAAISNLYSSGYFCCNALPSGQSGGAITCYVTGLVPGMTYEVTYLYHVELDVNGVGSQAQATIIEGKERVQVFTETVSGSGHPGTKSTFTMGTVRRVVQVTASGDGEAFVFHYVPSATTSSSATPTDDALARGEFIVIAIKAIE